MSHISEEYKILAFVLLMAVVLRFWQLEISPVEHFDEGIYASNIWFDASEGYRYPDRHLYAPPLLPAVIEWSHLFWGPGVWACIGANLLAGCATGIVIWRFLRRIVGPVGGLTAAALWSFHDLPILYARTALTESLLCLWMIGSITLAERVLAQARREGYSWQRTGWGAAGAGLLAGLAWATKYNGWLTLAIILSASLAWMLFGRWSGRERIHTLGLLAIIIAVAGMIWWPVLAGLQEYGGYAAVAANHRQYFGGLTGWGSSWLTQLRNYWLLTSLTSGAGLLMAGVIAARSVFVQLDAREEKESQAQGWSALGLWMIASWGIGLSVAIPLYYPYPRLLLPWVLAACLVGGVGFQWLANRWQKRCRSETVPPVLRSAAFWGICLGLGLLACTGPLRYQAAWEDRRGLSHIAAQFIAETNSLARQQGVAVNEVVFYVYGEPALFYHLSAEQRLAGPIGHLDFARPAAGSPVVPTFLVVGPHAERSPLFQQQWQELSQRFELIVEQPYLPSLFIQLNERNALTGQPHSMKLYRVKDVE